MTGLRTVVAPNPGPFILDGTRTYLIGTDPVAVIDPGPDDPAHVDRVSALLEGARSVRILLTHDHGDHAGGAAALARATGTEVLGPGGDRPVSEGDRFVTDHGTLVALSTPGHTRDHLSYHLPESNALFVGDLLLGTGDTTWIGEYAGGIADYLDSLDRIDALGVSTLYPGHGPPLPDPAEAVARFRRHRTARIEQVRQALARNPDLDPAGIVDAVYGSLPDRLREAALASVEAVLDYLGPRP